MFVYLFRLRLFLNALFNFGVSFEYLQGLIGSAMVFAIHIYVVERGGPLFVSAYLPLQTLIAAILATFAFGGHFYLGRYVYIYVLLIMYLVFISNH